MYIILIVSDQINTVSPRIKFSIQQNKSISGAAFKHMTAFKHALKSINFNEAVFNGFL